MWKSFIISIIHYLLHLINMEFLLCWAFTSLYIKWSLLLQWIPPQLLTWWNCKYRLKCTTIKKIEHYRFQTYFETKSLVYSWFSTNKVLQRFKITSVKCVFISHLSAVASRFVILCECDSYRYSTFSKF